MSIYLGIDTSNYTTSVCLYDADSGKVISKRRLLPVKDGELGLRQSDAVFHHVQQLPDLFQEAFSAFEGKIKDPDSFNEDTDMGGLTVKAITCSGVGDATYVEMPEE